MFKRQVREISILFHLAAEKGILLIIAAAVGMIFANSSYHELYHNLLHSKLVLTFNETNFKLSVHHFVNDFLMAIFFLVIGLEIKYEVVKGHLATWKQRILPLAGAVGGMAVPIAIYTMFNYGDEIAMRGWAVPGATDIAFALGMLALFGKGLPVSIRVFLAALAILDDLFAVIIIALFYSDDISNYHLGLAFMTIALLFLFNRLGIRSILIYVLTGLFLWYCFYKSGVHATIGGVILGLTVPIGDPDDGPSPLKYLEKSLERLISFIVLPLFAFLNCGISFGGDISLADGVVLGSILGLFIGKQVGIMGLCGLIFKLGISQLPKGANMKQFYGASILCGIGFTMSLFIGILAFENNVLELNEAKLGVVIGSALSALLGALVLKWARK